MPKLFNAQFKINQNAFLINLAKPLRELSCLKICYSLLGKQRNGGKMRTGSNEKKKEYIHENDSS